MFGIGSVEVLGPSRLAITFAGDKFDPATVDRVQAWTLSPTTPDLGTCGVVGVAFDPGGAIVRLDVSLLASGTRYRIAVAGAKSEGGDSADPAEAVFTTGRLAYPLPPGPPGDTFVGLPDPTDLPPATLFRFLQEGLRRLDRDQGGGLLERLLARPSDLVAATNRKIARIPFLVDPARTPAGVLDLLRAHVGFGPGTGLPDEIASRLLPRDLRRLVKIAVRFWRARGRRDGLSDAIRSFASGLRPAIDDWFDLRTLIDEGLIGCEGTPGGDLWAVFESIADVPEGDRLVEAAECGVSIRVPDLGDLDRDLVLDLCELARPVSERFEIAFVDFLDLFADGRGDHWIPTAFEGAIGTWGAGDSSRVPPRLPGLDLAPGAVETLSLPLSAGWTRYTFAGFVEAGAGDFQLCFRFYVKDSRNFYQARILSNGDVAFDEVTAGAWNTLIDGGVVPLFPGRVSFRIELDDDGKGGPLVARLYLDEDLALELPEEYGVIPADPRGTVGIWLDDASTAPIRLSRVEVHQNPVEIAYLGPSEDIIGGKRGRKRRVA